MKRICTFFIVLSFMTASHAQNLVPNPSFEILDSCPSTFSEIEAAPPWRTFRGSVDLYNTCDTSGIVGVPSNFFGYQMPFEGSGYAGLISYLAFDSLQREFMGSELLYPLEPGVPVYISFHLAIGGWGLAPFSTNLSTSGVGVFFSTFQFLQSNGTDPLPNWTAVHCAVAPTDSAAWTLVSGEFIPDSAYTQIVIGLPLYDSDLEVVHIDSAFMTPTGAYVYIDAVCVSPSEGECPLAMSHPLLESHQKPRILPNPCTDYLVIDLGPGVHDPDHYDLYDMRGALVESGALLVQGTQATIESGHWPAGVFSLVVRSQTVTISRATVMHLQP